MIQPLVEAGMEMCVHLHLEVTGEVDANLIDLSVKESVLQFDATGKIAQVLPSESSRICHL